LSEPHVPDATSGWWRTRVVIAALAVATGGVLPPFLVGAVGVRLTAEFGLGPAYLGLLVSAMFVTAGLVALPAGRWVDRWGWRPAIRLAGLGSASMLVAVAVLVRDPIVLAIILVGAGAAHGIAGPAANLAISRELPPGSRGVLFGLKQSSTSAAVLAGGLMVPTLVVVAGWRAAFLVAASIPLVAFLAVPSLRSGVAPDRSSRDRAAATRQRPSGLRLVTLAGGSASATVTATAAFLILASVEAGLTEAAAGFLLAIGSAASLISRIALGWYADRRDNRSLVQVAVLLSIGVVGLLGLASGRLAGVMLGAIIAFAAGTGWPGLFHLAVIHRHQDAPAAATGQVQLGLSIGAALGPAGFGAIAQAVSFQAAWVALAGLATVAGLLFLRVARRWDAEDSRRVALV
jgi:MFS family permease